MAESAAYTRRSFGKTAKPTTLAGSIDNATTTIALVDGSTYPDGSLGPFMITLDLGLTSEERVEVASRSGNSLTGCVRGADGTTPQAHATTVNGVIHGAATRDFDEANTLISAVALNSARVFVSSTFSIAHNITSVLAFDSERWDKNSLHSVSVNTSRLTCQKAGKYLIFGHVQWAGNASGIRQTIIRVNGVTEIAAVTSPVSSTQLMNQSLSTVYDLSLSDYVELTALQDSGGALNMNAGPNFSPEFGMQFLGF